MTPEALRRRMAHGNIYAAEKVDAALGQLLPASGNLAALRELALLWVADRVDEGLEEYRERHGITEPWETRERVVVALTGAPGRRPPHPARRPPGRPAATPSWSASTSAAADGLADAQPRTCSNATARCSSSSAAGTPRSTGTDVADALHRLRPRRERHPDRPRRVPAVPVGRAHQGLGHQPGHRQAGRDRRPRHLGRRPTPSDGDRRSRRDRRRLRRPGRPGPADRLGRRRSSASRCSSLALLPFQDAIGDARRSCCCCSSASSAVALLGGLLPGARRLGRRLPVRRLVLHRAHPQPALRTRPATPSPSSCSSPSPSLVSGLVDRLARRTAELARGQAETEALAALAQGTAILDDAGAAPRS